MGWLGLLARTGILFLIVNAVAIWQLASANEDYEEKCNKFNGTDCSACAKDPKCYWCTGSKTCHYYQWSSMKTYFKHCSWGQARWKTCWLNVEALVISLSVIGGIFLIAFIACCCWCRGKCRKRTIKRIEREEEEMQRQEAQRLERNAERRAERESANDKIRQKYGIFKNKRDQNSYKKMENDGEN